MKIFATLLAAVVLAGCVSSAYRPIGSQTFAPRPDSWAIDVFMGDEAPVFVHQSIENPHSESEVPIGATRIGRIDTNGAPLASWGSMIDDAKDKARELGGDAILVGGTGNYVQSVDSWGQAQHGKVISLWVLRYR